MKIIARYAWSLVHGFYMASQGHSFDLHWAVSFFISIILVYACVWSFNPNLLEDV